MATPVEELEELAARLLVAMVGVPDNPKVDIREAKDFALDATLIVFEIAGVFITEKYRRRKARPEYVDEKYRLKKHAV